MGKNVKDYPLKLPYRNLVGFSCRKKLLFMFLNEKKTRDNKATCLAKWCISLFSSIPKCICMFSSWALNGQSLLLSQFSSSTFDLKAQAFQPQWERTLQVSQFSLVCYCGRGSFLQGSYSLLGFYRSIWGELSFKKGDILKVCHSQLTCALFDLLAFLVCWCVYRHLSVMFFTPHPGSTNATMPWLIYTKRQSI